MSAEFEWHERGTGLELHVEPGRVRVELVDDDERLSVEFAPTLLDALVDQLDGHDECVPADQLGEVEHERDELRERVTELEAELRARLLEVEAHKSAGELHDRRIAACENERDAALLRAESAETALEVEVIVP